MKTRKILLPSDVKEISNKNFSYETYITMYGNSTFIPNKNKEDRIINKDLYSAIKFSEQAGLSYNSFDKKLEYLIDKEYIISNDNEFIINNKINTSYVLSDSKTIKKLLDKKIKNIIRVFIIYCKYTNLFGQCTLTQKEVLEQIGLKNNSKNLAALRNINNALEELGLIEIKRSRKKVAGKLVTYLNIKKI